ncbi:MAG: YdeI/OmpD-associated family protein [Planctomycetota bacterium]
MSRFETVLVAGRKAPYTSWTFIEVPADVARSVGHGPVHVVVAGTSFRGTASRSQGVLRIAVKREVLEKAGVARGDRVSVTLSRDTKPRPVVIPDELRAVLDKDPALAQAFEGLPPSHRRAWADYIGEAKQPPTRLRRAAKAREGILGRAFPR